MITPKIQSKIFILTLVATIITAAFFVFPTEAQAAPGLPVTSCDDEIGEIFSTFPIEDGTQVFTYGTEQNDFVEFDGVALNFYTKLLFPLGYNLGGIFIFGFDENCLGVLGGIAENQLFFPLAENQFSYETTSRTITINGVEIPLAFHTENSVRYLKIVIGAEYPDGTTLATNSYVIDVQNPQSPNDPIAGHNPVLIVPGIPGTDLFYNSQLSWPDLSRMFTTNDVFLLNELGMTEAGQSINQIETGDIIRSYNLDFLPDSNIFSELISQMENAGYVEGDTFFVFPYDWRLDLDVSSDALKNKVEQIKSLTDSNKIDIVAHSMGGLVVENYLYENGKSSINKLIFVGTPHLGAPKAGKILLKGDKLDIPWLRESVIKDLSRNFPSVYQLLPTSNYFATFQGYIKPFSVFGSNILNFNETRSLLIDKDTNSTLLGQAQVFFNKDLANQDFTGVEVYNIAGCKTTTQAAYSYGIGNFSINSVGYTSGDGTVPQVSAESINIPTNFKYYVKNGSHAELPSIDGAKELILGILLDNIQLSSNVSQSSAFCNFKGKKLSWHSPVEVHVYDSFGNHSGPIVGGLEYNIPGVDYEVIEEKKFIYLPTDEGQEYKVIARGLAQGQFDLLISEDDNGITGTTYIFDNVNITDSTQITFNLTESSQDDKIQIDVTGSGIFENLPAGLQLEGDVVFDTRPPEFQVNFDLDNEDFTFSAIDNTDTDPDITCTNSSCTAEDWAGNRTTVTFKELNFLSLHTLQLKFIDFGNGNKAITDNLFLVNHIESKDKIRLFNQTFLLKSKELLRISYDAKKGQSNIIYIENGFKKDTNSGISLLQLSLNEGNILSKVITNL